MGIFSIFKKKELKLDIPVDLSLIGTDIHSHFIPGIDDGAQTMDDSLTLISAMKSFGYKKVITSPHVMGDGYRNTSEIILNGLENVKSTLAANDIAIEMDAVAEYYVDFDFQRKLDNEKLLTFGKNYLLFEVSYLSAPENLQAVIFKMQTMGYKPVLAHPERYNFWHGEFEKYQDFIDKGVLLQLNINSLTGYYSQATKHIAKKMIDNNMISFVGTDCHHSGHIALLKNVVYEPHLQKLLESGKLLNKTL
jgi:tyrosine-protein phosphatase YwqE